MDSQELRDSLNTLAGVADKPAAEHLGSATDIELLDAAIERVSQVVGSTTQPTSLSTEGSNWVSLRIESTGVRTRVVEFKDKNWFKRSTLCLIGFSAKSNSPVALIPTLGAYKLYDPRTGIEKTVTPEVAQGLADTAYMIYPTFEPGPVTWRSLVKILGSQLKGQVPVIFALGFLVALIGLVSPIMVGLIFNQVLPHQQPVLLVGIAVLLAATAVTTAIVEVCSNLASARLIGRLETVDESALLDRVMSLPSGFIRTFSTGDLGSRLTGLQQIRNKALTIILSSGLSAVMSVISLILLFVYSPRLAVVALIALIILLSGITYLNLRRVRWEREMLDAGGEVDASLFEWVRSIPKIQIAGAERRIMTRWSNVYSTQQSRASIAGRTGALSTALLAALTGVLSLVLYIFAGYFFVGDLSGGSYLAFYSALGQFTAAVMGLTATLGPIIEISARWKRLQPVFDQEEERFGTQSPGKLEGSIKITKANFSYSTDSAQVLHNVDLDIKPGEFVAVTGPSGCGKSTLLRLLLGLDRPDTGSVSYDGIDLNLLDMRQVRSQLGAVIQNAKPLPGEILETILGEASEDEERAWVAAEAAGIADDIRAMPMKMKTLIGEGGGSFSGGQIQRLMIARAIARKPKVLLFDEATSALDDRTQQRVSENIEQLDVTRVVIAHRLSTVRKADKIVVMDRGQIVDQGSFDELMSRPGIFRNMAERQLTQ